MNYNKYIGIPWVCGGSTEEGADCWGIVKMVYKDLLNIEIGHYNVSEINNSEKTSDKIEMVRDSTQDWIQTENPAINDVIMMVNRMTGRPEHVGIFIGKGKVLHSMTRENGQSEIHDIKLIKRLFKRLEYYRYAG